MKIRAVRVAQVSLIGTVAALGWLGLRSAAPPQQQQSGVRSTIALLPLSRWSWDIRGWNTVPVKVPLRLGEAVLVHRLRRHRDGTTVSLHGLWVRRTQNESGFENHIFSPAEIAAGSLPPGTRTIRATLAEGEEMAFGWDEHSHTLGMWVPGRYRRLGFLGIGQSSTLQWPSPATP